ncbi:MAG: hypothetical protein WC849_02910 [Candidatus Paceibacterota bacterium]
MSITKEENEKIVDLFSEKEIKDPFGPNPRPEKKPTQQKNVQEETCVNSEIERIFARERTWGDFWKVGFFN